jgi:hypothetical protein
MQTRAAVFKPCAFIFVTAPNQEFASNKGSADGLSARIAERCREQAGNYKRSARFLELSVSNEEFLLTRQSARPAMGCGEAREAASNRLLPRARRLLTRDRELQDCQRTGVL